MATASDDPARAGMSFRCEGLLPKWSRALHELLAAYDYARSMHVDAWQFAVGVAELRDAGLSDSDCRWLVCADYAEHAQEVTQLEDGTRRFQRVQNLSLSARSCFVFTGRGAAFARNSLDWITSHLCDPQIDALTVGRDLDAEELVPCWSRERHELRLGEHVVKRFRWIAANQEMILAAFEEEGWPVRIDDPLPPQPEQDSKRRLHDTIKCLNRNQKHRLIHFGGDGTGEGIVWSLTHGALPHLG